MAFKDMSARFDAKMASLYGKASAKTRSDGSQGLHPIIETKPSDGNKPNYGEDTRAVPFQSIGTDFKRMTTWSTSPEGLNWYAREAVLQTGNTFSETRLFNPLFVIGNTQPFYHFRRPLSIASANDLKGDITHRSPGATNNIGSAGRLQIGTARRAAGNVVLGNTNNALAKLIKIVPPVPIVNIIGGALGLIQDNGIMGIDQRPEFDIGTTGKIDKFYSTALWQGLKRSDATSGATNLDKAAAALRNGDIASAIKSVGAAVKNTISDIGGLFGSNSSKPKNLSSPEGYFIINNTDALRYLDGSINYGSSMADYYGKPTVSLPNNMPWIPTGDIITAETTNVLPLESTSASQSAKKQNALKTFISNLITGLTTGYTSPKPFSNIFSLFDNGPANVIQSKAALLYPKFSLESLYQSETGEKLPSGHTVAPLTFVTENLTAQQQKWLDSLPTDTPLFRGGINTSLRAALVPYDRSKNYFAVPVDENNRRSYFNDPLNDYYDDNLKTIEIPTPYGNEVSALTMDAERKTNLIDLYFYDFVNKVAISFRAYLSGISEQVQPSFTETNYIGRIERNVVYTGVKREVTFQLMVHAANEKELDVIWKKINYLTGLCYPADYNNGFMVPPFVKLTLGDIYNNQPGYIQSLTHTVDDDTPWEITPGAQVPHGITMNVSFAIIEKTQMRTPVTIDGRQGTPFYGVLTNRSDQFTYEVPTEGIPTSLPDFPLEPPALQQPIDVIDGLPMPTLG